MTTMRSHMSNVYSNTACSSSTSFLLFASERRAVGIADVSNSTAHFHDALYKDD